MVHFAKEGGDPKLHRARRVLGRAEAMLKSGADRRRARVMEIELRRLIADLKAGADGIAQEISRTAQRVNANSIYRRCFRLARFSSKQSKHGGA